MYELIISEKPSAAKKIAQALSNTKPVEKKFKGVTYYELTHGDKDIVVVSAVGHLFSLAEKVKTKGFKYPVFDIEWTPTYEVSKGSAFAKKYFDTIKKMAKDASEVTVATDYDIEGEVIGINIVKYICNRNDAKRMKFSTLTKPDLVESYDHAQKTIDWGQAEAGETRHFLDYYYGINLSRALTSAIKSAGMFKLLSTGRVQGPALKIVVDREKEIIAFKPDPFWQIELESRVKRKKLLAMHETEKFWDKKEATKVHNLVKNEKTAKVLEIKKRETKQVPPYPFDLTTLQTEAYKNFSSRPKKTLEIAQELYTGGFLSYPRTSSQQIPEAIGYVAILKAIALNEDYKELASEILKIKNLKPNNGKKTDPAHPAIYPTGIIPKGLEKDRQRLYDLVVKRFLATFSENALRETNTIKIDVKKEIFIAKGTRTSYEGWHKFYRPYVKLEEEELPKLDEGDELKVEKFEFHSKETQPPKRYTPSSLIKALEKRNLGTKATRAEIIDTLQKRNYVQGESIKATDLGIHTINLLEKYVPKIVDHDLTQGFEDSMELIRQKKAKREDVLTEARKVVKGILKEFKDQEKEIGEGLKKTFTETRAALTTVGECHKCEDGKLIIRRGKFGRFIACDNHPDCLTTFSLPKNGLVEISANLCETCTFPVVKVIRKGKRPQEACINPDCPSKDVDKVEGEGATCEKCGKGTMIIRKSIYGAFLACDKYPKCKTIKKIPKEGEEEKTYKKKTTKKKVTKNKTTKKEVTKKKTKEKSST